MSANIAAAKAAFEQTGSKAAAARLLGIPVTTLKDRLNRPLLDVKGRKHFEVENGVVLVFGDAHYWPGTPSVAHRALVKFCKKLKPVAVICHGDALDGSSISRFPPINWESCPSVQEELEVCQERLGEIVRAWPRAKRFWALGNHDSRFSAKLAQVAPEFRNVHGVHLHDHFSGNWENCWSVFINNEVVVKHRIGGGVNAPYQNVLKSQMSVVTGHLHSQKVVPFTGYKSTLYGVDTGCLADPYHSAFLYNEDSPRNHRSGFCVLTFVNGSLLMPELVSVWDESTVQFRGELINV